MPAKVAWMDVDLAEELTLTIGTGDVPVEIETGTVMKRGVVVATVIVMERGVVVAMVIVMERGVAVVRLTATEDRVAVTGSNASLDQSDFRYSTKSAFCFAVSPNPKRPS
jgi:hypothetical protein